MAIEIRSGQKGKLPKTLATYIGQASRLDFASLGETNRLTLKVKDLLVPHLSIASASVETPIETVTVNRGVVSIGLFPMINANFLKISSPVPQEIALRLSSIIGTISDKVIFSQEKKNRWTIEQPDKNKYETVGAIGELGIFRPSDGSAVFVDETEGQNFGLSVRFNRNVCFVISQSDEGKLPFESVTIAPGVIYLALSKMGSVTIEGKRDSRLAIDLWYKTRKKAQRQTLNFVPTTSAAEFDQQL